MASRCAASEHIYYAATLVALPMLRTWLSYYFYMFWFCFFHGTVSQAELPLAFKASGIPIFPRIQLRLTKFATGTKLVETLYENHRLGISKTIPGVKATSFSRTYALLLWLLSRGNRALVPHRDGKDKAETTNNRRRYKHEYTMVPFLR